MRLTVYPILSRLRALYEVGVRNTLDRYWAYKALMVDGPEFLPLTDFSPMGQRQPGYLDALLAMNAEDEAAALCRDLETELAACPLNFRVLLVVVDQPNNGWTQRWLTDADWRFRPQRVPQSTAGPQGLPWITVQLWTHVPPTARYLRSQLRGAVMRAVWRAEHPEPATLGEMMRQEGAALHFGEERFADEPLPLDPDELSFTREVLVPLRASRHWPTCFAALYGDEPAREVGFPPLGLGRLAGLALAVSEAAAPVQITV